LSLHRIQEHGVPGHWEGDLIKGAGNRSSIGTLFTALSKLDNASVEAVLSGFRQVLNRIEAQKRLSMTYDQGREMAAHQKLTAATGVKVFFADPHSPWQRGINEILLKDVLPDLNVNT
jgi:IS30 family transposase